MTASVVCRQIFAGALLFAGHTAAAQTYTYLTITPPGSVQTTPVALGESGIVLGIWYDSGFAAHGFTFQNGTYTTIDYPNAIYTDPSGFNDKGEIVGSYTDATHVVHAFLYKKGKFTTISAPGASITELSAINDRGSSLGFSSAGTGSAFVYKNGTFTTIDDQQYVEPLALNNAGSATGSYFPPQPQPITAFLYDKGKLITIPVKSNDAEAVSLNSRSDVVGIQIVGNIYEGFLYGKDGKVKTILVPQSTGTYPEAISDLGDITGYYTDPSYTEFGFVLSKGALVTLSAPNAAGTYGMAINKAGEVLGGYHDSNRTQYTFLATPSN